MKKRCRLKGAQKAAIKELAADLNNSISEIAKKTGVTYNVALYWCRLVSGEKNSHRKTNKIVVQNKGLLIELAKDLNNSYKDIMDKAGVKYNTARDFGQKYGKGNRKRSKGIIEKAKSKKMGYTDVNEVKKICLYLRENNFSYEQIGRLYGVSRQRIFQILTNKGDIDGPESRI